MNLQYTPQYALIRQYNVEQKKPDTERYILYHSIYM